MLRPDAATRPPVPTTGPTANGKAPPGFHFIYFMGNEDGGEVKCGRTKQFVWERRRQHENQNGHDRPLRTLAVVLGTPADEAAVKRHFTRDRSRSRSPEWFHDNAKVRAYLRWLRHLPFVATTEQELRVLTPVASALWLPGEGREMHAVQLRIAESSDAWHDLDVDHVMEGDFYTDPRITDPAREAMGSIDLDPASCRDANDVIRAARYYGFHDNGLLHEWHGNVWCNPPYGMWDEWVPKILAEWNKSVQQMCVLCPTRAITAKSVHPLVEQADAVLVFRGRIPFWGPKAGSPDEGHVVFYFGPTVAAFRDAYAHLGTTFVRASA